MLKTEPRITDKMIVALCDRLRENKRIRRNLPQFGRIHIDRQLPFLCLFRQRVGRPERDMQKLATSEASYIICSARRSLHSDLQKLISAILKTQMDLFGTTLIMEIWSGPPLKTEEPVSTELLEPHFKIYAPAGGSQSLFAGDLKTTLERISIGKKRATVLMSRGKTWHPKRLPPILPLEFSQSPHIVTCGLEVRPIFKDPNTDLVFPAVLRKLQRGVSVALRRALFNFSIKKTSYQPAHFHSIGRQSVVKAVRDVDANIAESASQFDFLLQVTPTNAHKAWLEFRRKKYEKIPDFNYRPLPADPLTLKRRVYRAPVENVEDPALESLFRDKIEELDRQITMLQDINTPRFLHGSLQLYGQADEALLATASEILRLRPATSRRKANYVSPEYFASRAKIEIDSLKTLSPELNADVELRSDVVGVMVSEGNLLISTHSEIDERRVEALIQHEVGTHVLTYHNGRQQIFKQLSGGLAGYEELQEGLAVLAEYMVGGLSISRLRTLAGRVVAVDCMVGGASFVEAFRVLCDQHRFTRKAAFNIVFRVARGGILTKDVIYLRGLMKTIAYIASGKKLETLYVGKIGLQHAAMMQELLWRKVIKPPPLLPRFLSTEEGKKRLSKLREHTDIIELIKGGNI